MGNKINLEEFLLHQYNETMTSKDRLESKTSAYLAANALILAVLATFISILKDGHSKLFHLLIWSDMIVFLLGVVNLLICIIILLPRKLWSFDSEKLMRLISEKSESENTIDINLLKENEKFIYFNKKVIQFIRTGYIAVSVGLLIQIIGFALVSIIFFLIILGV